MPRGALAGPKPGLDRLMLTLLFAPLVMGLQRDHFRRAHIHSENGHLRQLIGHRQAQRNQNAWPYCPARFCNSPTWPTLSSHFWPRSREEEWHLKPVLGRQATAVLCRGSMHHSQQAGFASFDGAASQDRAEALHGIEGESF